MKLFRKIWVIVLVTIFCITVNSAQGASSVFTKNLTIGSRGSEVSALQQILIDGGFLEIATPTGYFGPMTRKALGAWQASVNISPTAGYFGVLSRARMNASIEPLPTINIPVKGIIATTTELVESTGVAVGTATILRGTTTVVAINNRDGSPIRLTIPKINVNAGFQYTGITPDGAMEIPNNIVDIGWFTGSARPGEKGTSVITGHVAQIRGGAAIKPGVFTDLSILRPGDTLSILNDKGESINFVVRESRLYDPAANATDVFAAADDGAHLNIITCEGAWNPDKLSYDQRLVVFTDAVK
ncbi:MAG: Peptidase C60 sortase A and B [Candidatus Wolfebacteria bacterium GW2011_GWE2_44_13]|uniref:Peptidase C60 sortase A and B n=1 Tax=Candidatus Wolfebacteria bacterium GW2011_GWE2_44_13 TaxID=1619017 RepID=A0A0G1K7U6_9BACT|nr:MAG: Peptidase C60 sortase A and B [Candidatus Wolfebacteria bacterium GW2011_GWE2_44_13]